MKMKSQKHACHKCYYYSKSVYFYTDQHLGVLIFVFSNNSQRQTTTPWGKLKHAVAAMPVLAISVVFKVLQ